MWEANLQNKVLTEVEQEQMHDFWRQFAEKVANIEFAVMVVYAVFLVFPEQQESVCGYMFGKLFFGPVRKEMSVTAHPDCKLLHLPQTVWKPPT